MKKVKLFINNSWQDAQSGVCKTLINPSTEEVTGEFAYGDEADFYLALNSAKKAFEKWKKETPYTRGEILKNAANFIRANIEQFTNEMILETGKPAVEAKGEWSVAANLFEWYAEEGKRTYGRVVPTNRKDKRSSVIYQPMGIIGVITAWNFPAYNPARAVAAALAAGCTVILKGAEQTPFSSANIAKALEASKLPEGVINVINAPSNLIGQLMLNEHAIRKISFTGSTAVGKILMDGSSKTNKKLALELGGNAPVIIDEDVDVKKIAQASVVAKLRNCGQVCVSPQRFYVHKNIYDKFIFEAKLKMESLKISSDTNSELGPLINKQQRDNVLSVIENAKSENAEVVTGGESSKKGFFVTPTLIKANQKHKFIHKEIFGPVMPVIPFETREEVINWANETEYGLAAYVFTNNISNSYFYSENLEFGIVGINEWAAHGTELPFGGWKQSGLGHESGQEGIREYMELKLISVGGVV